MIGYAAFEGFTGLTEIVLNEGLNTVSECAFQNCTALERIAVPSIVTFYQDGAMIYPHNATCGSFPRDEDRKVAANNATLIRNSCIIYVPTHAKFARSISHPT